MGFLESLNDDQVALLGCAVALFLCGGAMTISYTLRRWVSGEAMRSRPHTRPSNLAAERTEIPHGPSDDRKAA